MDIQGICGVCHHRYVLTTDQRGDVYIDCFGETILRDPMDEKEDRFQRYYATGEDVGVCLQCYLHPTRWEFMNDKPCGPEPPPGAEVGLDGMTKV